MSCSSKFIFSSLWNMHNIKKFLICFISMGHQLVKHLKQKINHLDNYRITNFIIDKQQTFNTRAKLTFQSFSSTLDLFSLYMEIVHCQIENLTTRWYNLLHQPLQHIHHINLKIKIKTRTKNRPTKILRKYL